jgi:hypothetical protein
MLLCLQEIIGEDEGAQKASEGEDEGAQNASESESSRN